MGACAWPIAGGATGFTPENDEGSRTIEPASPVMGEACAPVPGRFPVTFWGATAPAPATAPTLGATVFADAGVEDGNAPGRGAAEAGALTPAALTAIVETPPPPAAEPPEPAVKVPPPGFPNRFPAAPLAAETRRGARGPVGVAPRCGVSGVPIRSHAASAGPWVPPQRGSRTMALSWEEIGDTAALELWRPSGLFGAVGADEPD